MNYLNLDDRDDIFYNLEVASYSIFNLYLYYLMFPEHIRSPRPNKLELYNAKQVR